MRLRRTSGVSPIVSRIESLMSACSSVSGAIAGRVYDSERENFAQFAVFRQVEGRVATRLPIYRCGAARPIERLPPSRLLRGRRKGGLPLAARTVQRRAGRPDPGRGRARSQLRREARALAHARRAALVALPRRRARRLPARARDLRAPARLARPGDGDRWLQVVVKHEALAVRRARAESVPVEEVDLDGHAPEAQRPVDELLAARERVSAPPRRCAASSPTRRRR